MPDSFCYLFTYPLENKPDEDEVKSRDQAASKVHNEAEDITADMDNTSGEYVHGTKVRSASL